MNTRSTAYRFGEYVLEPEEHRLTHSGREITIRPKNFQLLLCLLINQGHLLTKEFLLNSIWPDIFVTEKVLIQGISEIRTALNDRAEKPRFIKTVPRVGYKFIGTVENVSAPVGKESDSPARTSVAVLPFKDMSPDRDQGYFCEGLAEEIINALTHIEDLRVVARTSAFFFEGKDTDIREIGERLNAYAVLEGSVRRSGNQLRVSVQLVNTATGYHLWSEQYDRLMDDVFQVQTDIAVRVAEKLNIDILVSQNKAVLKAQTRNLQAYHSLLKGRHFMSREGYEQQKKAADYFKNAIAEDPQYALAYATLSICYMIMWSWDYAPHIEVVSDAKRFAEKAVELDENLGVAHSALGFASMYHDWNWQRAENSFLRARELSPGYEFTHHGYAVYCSVVGRRDRAVESCKKALELDPLSPHTHTYLGMFLLRAGKVEEAIHEFSQALELEPDQPQARWLRGQTLVLKGDHDEGIQEIKKALGRSYQNPMIFAGLGWALGVAGRTTEANQVLRALKLRSKNEYIRPYLIAKIHCAMGNNQKAFRWLSRAFEERDRKLVFITTDETLAALRLDNRFDRLLTNMGLPADNNELSTF